MVYILHIHGSNFGPHQSYGEAYKDTHLHLRTLFCQLLLQLTSEGSALPFMFAKTLSQYITKTLECKAPLMLD